MDELMNIRKKMYKSEPLIKRVKIQKDILMKDIERSKSQRMVKLANVFLFLSFISAILAFIFIEKEVFFSSSKHLLLLAFIFKMSSYYFFYKEFISFNKKFVDLVKKEINNINGDKKTFFIDTVFKVGFFIESKNNKMKIIVTMCGDKFKLEKEYTEIDELKISLNNFFEKQTKFLKDLDLDEYKKN